MRPTLNAPTLNVDLPAGSPPYPQSITISAVIPPRIEWHSFGFSQKKKHTTWCFNPWEKLVGSKDGFKLMGFSQPVFGGLFHHLPLQPSRAVPIRSKRKSTGFTPIGEVMKTNISTSPEAKVAMNRVHR